jgi:uncharacterized protein
MPQGIMKPLTIFVTAMLRLLLILIALVLLLRLLGWTPPALRRRAAPAPDDVPPGTDLVACARCRVHLPRAQALAHDQRWYCSAEHRDAS